MNQMEGPSSPSFASSRRDCETSACNAEKLSAVAFVSQIWLFDMGSHSFVSHTAYERTKIMIDSCYGCK